MLKSQKIKNQLYEATQIQNIIKAELSLQKYIFKIKCLLLNLKSNAN